MFEELGSLLQNSTSETKAGLRQMLPDLLRSDFARYVSDRVSKVVANHTKWGHLSASLQSQIPDFVSAIKPILPPQNESATFLHGDLNFNNIFGDYSETESFSCEHIIDFGDSFHGGGDPLWDFVNVHVAVFSCDMRLFRRFWDAYWKFRGFTREFGDAERRRMMQYLLLQEYEGAVRWVGKVKEGTWKMERLEDVELELLG